MSERRARYRTPQEQAAIDGWVRQTEHVGNKYGARRTVVDGISFASKREAQRYGELRLMEQAGQITALELQPIYPLVVNGMKIGRFTADFRYALPDGKVVVEDVKSRITAEGEAYRLRKKVVEACHGITITEVF